MIKPIAFNHSVVIVPLFDVHRHAPKHDVVAFKQTMRKIQQNSNYYTIIDGDFLENIVPGRGISSNDQVDSNTTQVKEMIELLRPIKHKILGMIEGNHAERTRKVSDLDLMSTICTALETPYWGVGGVVTFKVGGNVYKVALQHGCSGAKNSEGELYRLKEVYPEADIFLLGHDHKLFARPIAFLSQNTKGEDMVMIKWFCRGGSYLNQAEYARKRLYPILPTGSLEIKLSSKDRKIKIDTLMYANGELIN